MPFINKVTVKGTTYYLENLVTPGGAYTVRLPSNIQKDDVFVTKNTIDSFTVSQDDMKAMETKVNTLSNKVNSVD